MVMRGFFMPMNDSAVLVAQPVSPNAALRELARIVPAILNHLLSQDSTARRRLSAHAGKVACVDLDLIRVALRVEPDGLLASADGPAVAVTIRIKPADLPLLLAQRERAMSFVTIDGDAEFAHAISQVSQQLHWDGEADLARVVGDIAAARLAGGARALLATVKNTHRKLAETTAEYFLDEQPMLVRPSVVREFADEVARTRDDVERLGKRVARLVSTTR